MGFPISIVTRDQVSDVIMAALARGEGGWVYTPNLDILRQLTGNPEYAAMCRGASLRTADGMPLLWAARLRGTPLPMRVAGSDLVWSLTERAAREGKSIYFLGGSPGAAEKCIDVLRAKHPTLRVAGSDCPPPGFERDASYMEGLRARLAESRAEIVYVGLGAPKQDYVIRTIRDAAPRAWFLGIGVSFSFVAGDVRRAPRWAQRLGLEWLHRLVQEPGRLWKRYLVLGLPFAIQLLWTSAWERRSPNASRPDVPASGHR